MNVLGGNLSADEGTMRFAGAPFARRTPKDARAAGIGFVHQELNCFRISALRRICFLPGFQSGVLVDRRSKCRRATNHEQAL